MDVRVCTDGEERIICFCFSAAASAVSCHLCPSRWMFVCARTGRSGSSASASAPLLQRSAAISVQVDGCSCVCTNAPRCRFLTSGHCSDNDSIGCAPRPPASPPHSTPAPPRRRNFQHRAWRRCAPCSWRRKQGHGVCSSQQRSQPTEQSITWPLARSRPGRPPRGRRTRTPRSPRGTAPGPAAWSPP